MRLPLPSRRGGRALAGLALVAVLSACGGREQSPPPLARPPLAPDTGALGAGASALGSVKCSAPIDPQEVLRQLNAVRAEGRLCGLRRMPPAQALRWDSALSQAATAHSDDMASRNYFEHRNPEGLRAGGRAKAAGYRFQVVGENIAGGDRSVPSVMKGWLESPEHCENMLEAEFTDVALACVQNPASEWGTYWTMVLGRKR